MSLSQWDRRQQTGRLGELAACRQLETEGYTILGTNVRCGRSEIDIVAEHEGTLVFAEVRTRRSHYLGTPEESITVQKQQRMLTAAHSYLKETDGWHRTWRIDLVAVELDHLDRIARLSVIRDAVEL